MGASRGFQGIGGYKGSFRGPAGVQMGVGGLTKPQALPPLLHHPTDLFPLPRVREVSWTLKAKVVSSRQYCVPVSPAAMALGSPPEEGTVSVVVRVRPPAPCERERAAHPVLHVMDENIIIFDPDVPSGPLSSALTTRAPKHPGKDMKFVFDRVFGEGATQDEVFQHTTRGLLDAVLSGYNCSGKKCCWSLRELLPHPLL